MKRYIKRNNVILFIIELKVSRVVAIIAVKDEEAINFSYSSFSMLIKMLNLF